MKSNVKTENFQKSAVYIFKFVIFVFLFIASAIALLLLSSNASYPCGIADIVFKAPFSTVSYADDSSSGEPLYIVIDAGHGGEDGGAVSDSGIVEKDINLDIAFTLYELLKTSDYIPVMIRTEDRLMYEAGQENQKKQNDISNRITLAKEYNNSIFVSIHQNKFPIKKYKGFQVYYSKNNPQSEVLAKIAQNNIKSYLQEDNNREIKKADKNIRILDSLDMPAILAECGFLSNNEEAELLNTKEYRNKIAYLLYGSIIQYAKEYEDGKL